MPTALTFREDLIDRVRLRLAEISIANGFLTDAGQRIYVDELPTLGQDDPAVAIFLLVGDDRVTYGANEKITLVLPLEVAAVVRVTADRDCWRLREHVLRDVKRALELEDRSIGGILKGAQNFKRDQTRSRRREPGSDVMGSTVTYLVTYDEPWGGHEAIP